MRPRTEVMARYWMHNGFLQVEGQKMSKSLGNFVTIAEVLAHWPGVVARYNMLRTHYRQPIDWTVASLEDSQKVLRAWKQGVASVVASAPDTEFVDALSDDLNTHAAFTRLHALAKAGEWAALKGSLLLMGFHLDAANLGEEKAVAVDAARVSSLVTARLEARKARNFAESDRIRDELLAMGIQIKDVKDAATGELRTEWEVRR